MSRTNTAVIGACALGLLGACNGTVGTPPTRDGGGLDAVADTAPPPSDTGTPPRDEGAPPPDTAVFDVPAPPSDASDAGPSDAGRDATMTDPCAGAMFCEPFDSYAAMSLHNGQTFGPWRAALSTSGATMGLDSTHTVSGARALHVHIDTGVTAGGRLFSSGTLPVLATHPAHVYGRMMMYIDPNGTSVHWTFFGVSGPAVMGTPVAGRTASYIISSLPRSNVNTFSFVYGLNSAGTDPYHDCWDQGMTAMPTARWTCVSFEMDSVARRLRLYMDGGATPIVSVDDHGQGCVGTVVPGTSPWYGPAIDSFFTGAWSFHPMNGPLDVWIDDVIFDTAPVTCPTR